MTVPEVVLGLIIFVHLFTFKMAPLDNINSGSESEVFSPRKKVLFQSVYRSVYFLGPKVGRKEREQREQGGAADERTKRRSKEEATKLQKV